MRRLSALLLPLAIVLVAASSASAAPKMEIGLHDDGIFLPGGTPYFSANKGYSIATGIKVSWIRSIILWNSTMTPGEGDKATKPKTVKYDFSRWDTLVNNSRKKGFKVQLALAGPVPRWAHPKGTPNVYKPNAKYYGQWVSAVVKHFKGRVTRYSIWNEPNHTAWLKPLSQGPKLYRALYTAGYAAAKKADPKAQVFIGETAPYYLKNRSTAPLAFLRGVTCLNAKYKKVRHCAALKADGYASHPYDARHSPTYQFPGKDNVTIATLPRLTAALDKMQKAGVLKPRTGKRLNIYLTEFGYLAYGVKKQPEPKRAAYLVQAFKIAQKNPRVMEMLQYQLVQPPTGNYFFWQSYLIHTNGKASLTYTKFKAWAVAAAKKGQVQKPGTPH
jgi:hypothetical protein